MRPKRTPPASPLPPTTSSADVGITATSASVRFTSHESSLHHCASAPNLTLDPNISERKKRKCDGEPEHGGHLSIGGVPAHFTSTQYEDLMLKINNIILQNTELKQTVELMSDKYDEFLSRISSLEAEKKEDKRRIRQLEESLEHLERNSRASEIEIRNVPKTKDETKDDLCNHVMNLAGTLNININQADVKDIHRIRSKGDSFPIIVNFNSVITKEKLVKGVKTFNKTRKQGDKLNTTHLKLKINQPVYVSERLTFKGQKLYYLARTHYKSCGYNFCWTSRGVVYVRKNSDDPQIKINSEEDIQKLKPSSSI